MIFGSLFAGIGGLDLGLERAGWECAWQVEKDAWCRKVLTKHWPDVPKHEDVFEVGAENLEPVDLICGGFPCQPFSHAGTQKGAADDRHLWPEFARIIGELRPQWVLAENVPGLRSIDSGRVFGGVLRDLADFGYSTRWESISAASVGAPHIRDRVFIVAHADGRIEGRREQPKRGQDQRNADAARDGAQGDVAYPARERINGAGNTRQGRRREFANGGWWKSEPGFCRVADGVPSRVDRLRGLGNAVVPQVAEYVARTFLTEAE